MDAYRQDVCSRANEMLQKTIPEKLSTLDQLLQTERLQLDYCDEAREERFTFYTFLRYIPSDSFW